MEQSPFDRPAGPGTSGDPEASARVEGVKVLLVGDSSADEGSLKAQLRSLGHSLELARTPEQALSAVRTGMPDLVVIDGTSGDVDAFDLAARVKELTREKAVPVMFACLAGDLRAQVDSRDLGADDCFAKPIDTQDLAARMRLLLRNRDLELSLRRQNDERDNLNRQLVGARTLLERELDMAGRIQRSFLPESMPKLDRFQFAAALRPAGKVSGDFYDIFRLDEKHYGFYVADAVGHGVPAALLTVFVKKGLQTRETAAEGYRLLPPGEVLACLNRDIISQQLADSSFITIFYAVLDAESGRLSYACGGHPPALLSSADGVRRPLLCEGALLGIFETEFATGELTLSPGDCLLLYTDGIEEAHSPTGKKGLDALLEFLDARAVLAPASASQEPGDTLTRHLENALAVLFEQRSLRERRDDVTTLVLRMFA